MRKSNAYVLDTHIWIWLLTGNPRIKKSGILNGILEASKISALHISAISIWEIAMLEHKGRITLSTDIHTWIGQALAAPGIILIPLLPSISIDSTRLPGFFHGDPADRIIIATARHLQCPLITADNDMRAYGSTGAVRVIGVA